VTDQPPNSDPVAAVAKLAGEPREGPSMILGDDERYRVEQAAAEDFLRALPDRSVDHVFFSPPFEDQRTYGIDFRRKGQAWVDFLRPIVVECCRVSRGLVCINMAAKVEDFRYSGAVECLVADLIRLDGVVLGPSPYAWVKSENRDDAPGNGQPGSGGPRYQRRDWEPVYAFCLPDRLPLPWTDNTAFGSKPQYGPGGDPSHRRRSGSRANGKSFVPPPVSNPGNVIRVPVGGGKLGHPLAHEGEAPMPVGLPERFVCWFVPPGGIVLDPFCGTGTTLHAALEHGRRGLGCDVRADQVELARRRLATVTPAMV
jgi:hypothetical protein